MPTTTVIDLHRVRSGIALRVGECLAWSRIAESAKVPTLKAVICITAMLSSASADIAKSFAPSAEANRCRDQLTELVAYLKETAEIEGTFLRVEHAENQTNLNYLAFEQKMQCIDGALHIYISDPNSN